jgi:hypothetical protein
MVGREAIFRGDIMQKVMGPLIRSHSEFIFKSPAQGRKSETSYPVSGFGKRPHWT